MQIQGTDIQKGKVLAYLILQGKDFRQGPVQLALELSQGKKAFLHLIQIGQVIIQGAASQTSGQLRQLFTQARCGFSRGLTTCVPFG